MSQGAQVMAIDHSSERVDEFASIATQAVIADSTDESVLNSLGIRNFEHVIVAIGEDIQASILTTIILKEIGVQQITVKAQNDYHEKYCVKLAQILSCILSEIWGYVLPIICCLIQCSIT